MQAARVRQCQKEVRYLADRLAREERARGEAKTSDNETRFEQLSNNSTLIKSVMVVHIRGGTVDGMDVKRLEELRQQYEIDLKAVAEQAEMDDDDDSLVPQDAAAGAGAPEEEEEEWEMLDRLREEETRLKQAPVMKQRETFVTRPAPAPVAKAPRAPAPPANSKQAKIREVMGMTS